MDANYKRSLEANTWKVSINLFLFQFLVYAPILYISVQEKGISLTQIGVMMFAGYITLLIFNVPAGVLADRWGRKRVLLLAGVFSVIAMMLLTTHTYSLLLLGVVCISLSGASVLGTDTALLYDTLKELGNEKEYSKYASRRVTIGMAGLAVGSLTAAFISTTNTYSLHFIIAGIAFALAIIVSATMKEPTIHQSAIARTWYSHIKESFSTSIQRKEIRNLIIYTFVLASTLKIAFSYFPFFFKEAGVNPQYFGYLYSSAVIIGAIVAYFGYKLERRVGEKNMLLLIPLLLVAALLCLIFGRGIIAFYAAYAFFEILFGVQGAVLNSYLQRHLESKNRATIDSLTGFYGGLYAAILSLVVGFVADKTNTHVAFGIALVIALLFILPATYFLVKQTLASHSID